MPNIKLTFLEINPNTFRFDVYRKIYEGEKLEKDTKLFRYKLPEDEQKRNFQDYIISFEPIDETFVKFSCLSNYRHGLTSKYIFKSFVDSLELNKPNFPQFEIVEKGFRNQIDFTIKEYPEGKQIFFLFPYYLKALNKIGFICGFKFSKNDQTPFNRRVQQLSLSLDYNFKSNKNYYNDKFLIISNFSEKFFYGLSFTDKNNEYKLNTDFSELTPAHLEQKTFQFANSRTAVNQFLGIRSYGVVKPATIPTKFIFLFQDKHRNFANDLFLSLIGKANPDTFSGMEKFFQMNFSKEMVDRIILNDNSIQSIKTAYNEIINRQENGQHPFIIYIEPDSETGPENENNPYLFLKYNLTKRSIPLQVIDYSVLGKLNALKYSTSNIGLQIFAKLGGIPWKIKPKSENCLILGIGSAHNRNIDGSISKYVAYSICIDSSGVYKSIEMLSEEMAEENYLNILRQNLTELLKKDDYKHYKKCVLHLPFKIRQIEIESLKEVVKYNSSMEFRILKVNMDNKFFGVAEHATRVPYEGDYIQLSNNEYLVWFQGLQAGVNLVRDRTANPVHIEFLRLEDESKEQDYTYLQDIMNLSGANWRGFNAKVAPISVFYAQIFADYAQKFENFPDFSPQSLTADYPWFL